MGRNATLMPVPKGLGYEGTQRGYRSNNDPKVKLDNGA